MFYIENFALRLLFCIGICLVASNLASFVRAEFISHTPYAFDVVKNLVLPVVIGGVAGFMWKPRAK